MSRVHLGSFPASVDRLVQIGLRDLAAQGNAHDVALTALQQRPDAPPLTLAQIRRALSATGTLPLNIFQLLGQQGAGGAIQLGTHDDRLATAPASVGSGALWYETDRFALYGVISNVWTLLGSFGLRGTLTPDEKPTDLHSADAEFLFVATDFARVYRWSGTAWEDAPGQPARAITWVPYSIDASVFDPGIGYQLCDGSVNVPISLPDGTTTTITVPDLTTANRFLRAVAGATGGTGGSATTHTHQVDPPATTSGTPSLGVQVQAGATATVADQNHTHQVDIAPFASAGPSGAGGDDALPPYYDARPYLRL